MLIAPTRTSRHIALCPYLNVHAMRRPHLLDGAVPSKPTPLPGPILGTTQPPFLFYFDDCYIHTKPDLESWSCEGYNIEAQRPTRHNTPDIHATDSHAIYCVVACLVLCAGRMIAIGGDTARPTCTPTCQGIQEPPLYTPSLLQSNIACSCTSRLISRSPSVFGCVS